MVQDVSRALAYNANDSIVFLLGVDIISFFAYGAWGNTKPLYFCIPKNHLLLFVYPIPMIHYIIWDGRCWPKIAKCLENEELDGYGR